MGLEEDLTGPRQWRAVVLWCLGANPIFTKKFHLSCQNFWWPFLVIYI